MPSPGVFLMQRISKVIIPSTFREATLLCPLINFLWTLRVSYKILFKLDFRNCYLTSEHVSIQVEILKTTSILEKLKVSNNEKILAIELGESCGQCLYDLLRP